MPYDFGKNQHRSADEVIEELEEELRRLQTELAVANVETARLQFALDCEREANDRLRERLRAAPGQEVYDALLYDIGQWDEDLRAECRAAGPSGFVVQGRTLDRWELLRRRVAEIIWG